MGRAAREHGPYYRRLAVAERYDVGRRAPDPKRKQRPLPPAIAEDGTFICWRCVIERIATLHEIQDHWTIEDVLDANQMLDLLAAETAPEAA